MSILIKLPKHLKMAETIFLKNYEESFVLVIKKKLYSTGDNEPFVVILQKAQSDSDNIIFILKKTDYSPKRICIRHYQFKRAMEINLNWA
jgi:hypothetical protein